MGVVTQFLNTQVSTYEGLVATRIGIPDNTFAPNFYTMSISGHVALDDITSLKIAFPGFALSTGNPDEISLGSATWTASIEWPNGTFRQILTSGIAAATVPAGSLIFSDYATPTTTITKGSTFKIRLWQHNPSGIFYNGFNDSAMGDASMGGSSDPGDFTMGGAVTNLTGTGQTPVAIIARTKKASLVLLGDSICFGQSDTAAKDFRKGIVAKSIPLNTIGFCNLASPGIYAQNYLTKSPSRQLLFPYCSHVISQLGVNDLYPGARTSAQLITDLQAIWATFPAGTKIQQATISPETTSTDAWATTGNQTISSGNTSRVTFNTALRNSGSSPISGMNNGFQEYAWAIESSHDSGLWAVDGTANKYTVDGVHPSPFGYSQPITDMSRLTR